jgi:hypothetical protein
LSFTYTGRERYAIAMLSQTTRAMLTKPTPNITASAAHCVVSTSRKFS